MHSKQNCTKAFVALSTKSLAMALSIAKATIGLDHTRHDGEATVSPEKLDL
ncbi:hypothetical protein JHK86_017643 [Glycine max]|nr:hypothetical protein JHK86_017643 [Glycine max]